LGALKAYLNYLITQDFRTVSSPLAPILERYLWCLPVSTALGFVASTFEGLGIGLFIPLLAELLNHTISSARSGTLAFLSNVANFFPLEGRLLGVALCIFGLIVLKAVVQAVNGTFIAWVDGRVGHDIRTALSDRLLAFGYSFFLDHDASRLVTIVSTESWRASDAIRLAFSVTAALAAVIVFSLFLLLVSWKLFLFVITGLAAIRLAQLAFLRHIQSMSDRITRSNRALAARMLTIIDAMRLIRIFGQQAREQISFMIASEEARQALFSVERESSRIAPMIEVFLAALFIASLVLGHLADLPLPVIVTFLALLYRMQPHLIALNNARTELAALRGSIREVEWLMDTTGKPPAPTGSVPICRLDSPIVFEQVEFAYPSRPESGSTLSALTFVIYPKRATAIIGPSGAGKTTLINLICRLLEPTSGRIVVDGRNLSEINPENWRRHISLAGQDIDLIDGTIADNIAYGWPDASEKKIIEAARLADAHQFICALPEGYQTNVNRRGLNLSGGQRQRIGIARSLLRDPDILILDEATNAVDGISERVIMTLLKRRAGQKTTLVISHRINTIASCEDGLVLEDGRVVEAGPLVELAFFKNMNASAKW
jgi:ATP-binding cassette, subfamily B, bacterial MsbA